MNKGGTSGYVQLLGKALVRVGRYQIAFVPDKRHQLLAYLAYRGDWVSRENLACFFWPDIPKAQRNLRSLLQRVQRLNWLFGLEIEPQRLRWQVETDVAAFRRAIAEGDVKGILALYHGPLLEGLDGNEASAFSSWLEAERERLHISWREVLFRHTQALEKQGKDGEAANLLGVLLDKDALDEEALVAYLNACARAGRREQALRSYRDFSAKLHEELGLRPTSSTQRLVQAIQEGEVLKHFSSPIPLSIPARFPPPASSFIGRELELNEIARLLSKPECRLLTLTGPGGIGKTRLALQAMQELTGYPDGVYFLPLESLTAPELIPVSVAEALKVQLQGSEDPLQQVIRTIGNKKILLVLDNFEHLLTGAMLVSQLVQDCFNLKLLITSRERLNLAEEWLFPVEGLLKARARDAVTLFIERASQAQPAFRPTAGELDGIATLCRLVEGSPLAIELAAAWVKRMTCEEIVNEIKASLDFLTSLEGSASERHKSLRVVFEHSWNLLTPTEQEVLSKLSVFRGGFAREAAAVIAGASITVLTSLIDKSLLRITNGRYDRHPLVHGYAQEKLAEHPEACRTKEKHAGYFLELAEAAVLGLKGAQQQTWLERLEVDHDNLRAAMAYYLEAGEAAKSLRLATALRWLWVIRGHFAEGRRWFRAAFELGGEVSPVLRANALSAAGVLARRQGELASARLFFEESLALWREVNDRQGIASALQYLGVLAHHQGDYSKARALHEESLAIARELHDAQAIASSLLSLGNVALDQGNPQARALYEESLLVYEGIPDKLGIAYALDNLGVLAWAQNDEAAQALTEEVRARYQELGNQSGIANAVHRLGLLALNRGNYHEARAHYLESLAIKRELGEARGMAFILHDLARLALEQDERDAAQKHFDEGLRIALTLDAKTILILYLEGLAVLYRKQNQPRKAARLLGAASSRRQALNVPVPLVNCGRHERELRAVRNALDEAAFTALWQEGMTFVSEDGQALEQEAIAELLGKSLL